MWVRQPGCEVTSLKRRTTYEKVLSIDPTYIAAHHRLGLIRLDSGQLKEALPHLEKAAAERPEDPAVWIGLGRAYLADGRPEEANTSFEKAANLPGTVPDRRIVGLAW